MDKWKFTFTFNMEDRKLEGAQLLAKGEKPKKFRSFHHPWNLYERLQKAKNAMNGLLQQNVKAWPPIDSRQLLTTFLCSYL